MEYNKCEQCDGTGWAKGQRCGCREEDDEALERRKKIRLIRPGSSNPPQASNSS